MTVVYTQIFKIYINHGLEFAYILGNKNSLIRNIICQIQGNPIKIATLIHEDSSQPGRRFAWKLSELTLCRTHRGTDKAILLSSLPCYKLYFFMFFMLKFTYSEEIVYIVTSGHTSKLMMLGGDP